MGDGVRKPRVVLVHDWLCGYRGGEGVLEQLAVLCRDRLDPAALMVMFDDGRRVAPAVDAMRKVVSSVGRLPLASGVLRRWLLPLYPAAVSSLGRRLRRLDGVRQVDLVISSSSAAVKGLRVPERVPHICYCHAPARYLWGREAMYKGPGLAGAARSAGLRVFGPWLRSWDRRTASNVTRFIANSSFTAGEIKKWYGRDAVVVHPPVRTEFFTPDPGAAREDFWLLAGALEPYKRADVAIEAARLAAKRLVIAGGGSQLEVLRSRWRSAEHVEFLGRVSHERLRDLYRRAELLVHPQVEDFGIVAVEAQACGLPVLALRAGGAMDSVIDGVTGAFFDEAEPSAIAAASERVPRGSDLACQRNAERFRAECFNAGIMEQVEDLIGEVRG